MDVLIEKLNGEQKKFSEIGIIAHDFLVSTADVRDYKSEITGRPGTLDKGADYGPRTITVPFRFKSPHVMEYHETRDEVFRWLGGVEEFWIYEGRYQGLMTTEVVGEETKTFYESEILFNKRYLVRRKSNLAPDQNGVWGLDSISFETVGLPFGESPEPIRSSFTNPTSIQVFNGGTERIDPDEEMYLVIEYKGQSTDLTIKNNTNGTEWSFQGNSVLNDSIKIDGVHSTLNMLSIVRNTNLELIKLEPGQNDIEVTGATNGTLTFDFRWYYR